MQNFYFEAEDASSYPPAQASWKGHKRSLGRTTASSRTARHSSKENNNNPVAHPLLRQRTLSRGATCVITEGESDDSNFAVSNDHVRRRLRVVNIPDPSELENIPSSDDEGSTDEGPNEFHPSAAMSYQSPLLGQPWIAVALLKGKHHEVWDPKEGEFHIIKGRVLCLEGLSSTPGPNFSQRLHSVSVQLWSQSPRSKISHAREQEAHGSATLLDEDTVDRDYMRKAPQGPRKTTKADGKGNSSPAEATNSSSQPVQPSTSQAMITVILSRPGPDFQTQFAEFKARLPVGPEIFGGSGSGDVTRFYTIKAKAVFESAELGYSTSFSKAYSKEIEFSITTLKKKEIMDGLRGGI